MKCNSCNYEFTMREIQEKAACPKCAEAKLIDARAEELRAEKRKRDAVMAPHVREVAEQYRGAQPVVIMDINMSFGSMVRFMVKWVLASIPAIIILVLLFTGIPAFFGALLKL